MRSLEYGVLFLALWVAACGASDLRLRQVVLYQNGIGYFERSGQSGGGVLRLKLRKHEVDDVMKTLTVIGAEGGSALSAVVPEPVEPVRPDDEDEPEQPDVEEVTELEVRLGGGGRMTVSYAVPTPSWQAVYRIVLPDEGATEALLQAWAVVHNASGEDWEDVQLTLATGAPFSYAIDLRSPRFVARPDLTGEMVQPLLYGSVRSSQSRREDREADRDADGLLDEADDEVMLEESSEAQFQGAMSGGAAPGRTSTPRARRSRRGGPVDLAEPAAPPAPEISVDTVQGSTETVAVPEDSGSGTQYVISDAVTVPEATSTLVAIVNRRVAGREVLLFRPDPSTPSSRTHPFRAARIENPTDLKLVEGPVAMFARGTFVGDGVLNAVHPGENTVIPFSLDGSTTVLVRRESDRQPSRLVSIARGVMTVRDWDVRRTRYEIRAGEQTPSELVLWHLGRAGYELVDLPPQSEESGTATMIPVSITQGGETELVVEERRETRRIIRIAQENRFELGGYIDPDDLPEDVRRRLQQAIELRQALNEVETRLRGVREQAANANERLTQLQNSLRSIERSRTAAQLRRQLEARLSEATRQSEQFTNQIAALNAERAEARVRLTEVLAELTYGEDSDD